MASETPLWHKLVPSFTRGVLYLFDLGFFERNLFAAAQDAGAHVLMRLKKTAKVRVIGHIVDRSLGTIPGWSLNYYLTSVSKRRGTLFDPRTAAMLEVTRIADALRAGADQLDTLAAEAHRFEVGTLRRLLRASVLETIAAAVDAEAGDI